MKLNWKGLPDKRTLHGESNTPLFKKWASMVRRCAPTAKGKQKKYYYDKGITVCDEWLVYINFRDWALVNGWREGLEIDRRYNHLGYNPENCRFVEKINNILNRTNTVMVTYAGKTRSLVELAEVLKLTIRQRNTVRARIKSGWDVIKAIETPVKTNSLLNTTKTFKRLDFT